MASRDIKSNTGSEIFLPWRFSRGKIIVEISD